MTKDELVALMDEGVRAAMRVDALLLLIEDAAWNMVNQTIAGRECTTTDHERAFALHASVEIARKDFRKIHEAIAEGEHAIARAKAGQPKRRGAS